MASSTLPRIAILGAGPIGLEAGLYAQHLKLPFTIYEQGRVGEHVWRWGHVKLFSPFGMNATPLGRKAILAVDGEHESPADDACITGREHVERYLKPLADVLEGEIKTETRVINVARVGLFKQEAVGDSTRAKQPFLLLVRERNQDRYEEADIVLDCTGTYSHHRWLGPSGIPALGESQVEPHIAYHLVDVLGDAKRDYLNRSVLVVGAGYSAATTVSNFAKLAQEHNTTWITWVTRSTRTQPLKRIANDPLRERDRLAVAANNLATRTDANVEFRAGTVVESIEPQLNNQSFKVVLRTGTQKKTFEVDKIVANVGYTPDRAIYRELQVHECYASFGPMKLAAALSGTKSHDCLAQVGHGPETLRNPEPNFFILGAKSYGRDSHFLLRIGFEQVRDVFALITGKNPPLAA
ncbi:MAG: NAD(P)-binding domain-containing protein [Planctomycetes bacterium]|nr:NAD(P)-binding domain-containing protein [Planctomycetota bacterium]